MGGFTSGSHWLIVLAIVVLLFGAKKIPELAKGFGQGIRNFKKEMKEENSEEVVTPTTAEAPQKVESSTTATIVEAPKPTTQA